MSEFSNQVNEIKVVKTELTEEDVQFLLANTSFNREKILQWFNSFKAKCPQLKLTQPEFIKTYRKLTSSPHQTCPSELEQEFYDLVFKTFYYNHNGFI